MGVGRKSPRRGVRDSLRDDGKKIGGCEAYLKEGKRVRRENGWVGEVGRSDEAVGKVKGQVKST